MTLYILTSQKNTSVYYYYNFMWIDTFFIKPKLEGLIFKLKNLQTSSSQPLTLVLFLQNKLR